MSVGHGKVPWKTINCPIVVVIENILDKNNVFIDVFEHFLERYDTSNDLKIILMIMLL